MNIIFQMTRQVKILGKSNILSLPRFYGVYCVHLIIHCPLHLNFLLYYVILIHFDSIKEGNIVFGNYARHWGFPIIYTYFALKCVLLIIFCSECYHFQSLGPYNMLQHMEEGWKPTYKAHNELESLWSFLFKTDLVYFWSFFVLGFTPWKLILFVSSLLSHDGQYLNPLCANFHLTYIKTLYLTGWFLGTPIKMHKTVDLVVTIYERVQFK